MIKLDSTSNSVVVLCTECPFWYGFAFTRKEGWEVGRGHEVRAHPGATQATKALAMIRKRAALERDKAA